MNYSDENHIETQNRFSNIHLDSQQIIFEKTTNNNTHNTTNQVCMNRSQKINFVHAPLIPLEDKIVTTNVQKLINPLENTNASANYSIRSNNDPNTHINTNNQSITKINLHAMAYPTTQNETSLQMSLDMGDVQNPLIRHAR